VVANPHSSKYPLNALPGICLAARGERSDYSLINTSLQRGACGGLKAPNRRLRWRFAPR
jgi:hypothetical protein